MRPPDLNPAPHLPPLGEAQLAALRALAAWPSAIGPERAPSHVRLPRGDRLPRRVVAELVGLEALGLVERWEPHPDMVSWCLTAWGADALGLVLIEDLAGEPRWANAGDVPRAEYLPRWGGRGEPRWAELVRAELLQDLDGPGPLENAIVSECSELVQQFEALAESDPERALESLRRAETIFEGVSEVVRARWLWDADADRPKLVMGRLVPRDDRMG